MTDTARIIPRLGRAGLSVIRDRVAGATQPTTLDVVPSSAGALTPEWLTAVLCREHAGAAVIGIELGDGSSGSSERKALRVTYNDAGVRAGLPTELFTKSSPSLATRMIVGLTDCAKYESLFYMKIRPELPLNSPCGYYSAVDEKTLKTMIILENMAATQGCSFGDAKTYVDRKGAESMVQQMATYHGAFWNSSRLDQEFPQLRNALQWQQIFNARVMFKGNTHRGIERAKDVLDRELLARRDTLWDTAMRSLEVNIQGPTTLLHQDVHPGNWLHLPDGQMGLFDWQVTGTGCWALDFAYAITAGLEIENRRAWQSDLLDLYLETLAAAGAGADAPTAQEAHLAYRQQMYHGLIFWLFTIGNHALMPKQQPDEYSRIILRRISQAMVDHDSLTSI